MTSTNTNTNTNENVIVDKDSIHSLMFDKNDRVMELKMFIDSVELRERYKASAEKHNSNMVLNKFPDAGFDLFVPRNYTCLEDMVTKINFEVKCCAQVLCENGRKYNTGFYMYPRSSLSNTKLRLANSVGIIDSGYRGNLIGAFDCCTPHEEYNVLKYDKLTQICAPGLIPIYVRVVESEAELGSTTSRGDNGFGSTGK